MKARLVWLWAAVLTLALCATALGACSTATITNPNPAERLNLRTQPRKDAISLGKYYSGVVVDLLGEEQNGYVKVRIDPMEGWMDKNFLTDELTYDAPPTTTVIQDGANLRAQPTAQSKSLGTFDSGTWVCVLGVRDDSWLHVSINDMTGFMQNSLLAEAFTYHSHGVVTAGTGYAVVNNPISSERLNLRESPSGNAAILGKYYNGTVVEVLERMNASWARVRIGGTAVGYMQTKFLAMDGEPVEAFPLIPTIKNPSGTGLNLRETPSTNAKSLGLYPNGSQVSVLGVWKNGWVHVTVDGKTGYMQADKFDGDFGLTFDPLEL